MKIFLFLQTEEEGKKIIEAVSFDEIRWELENATNDQEMLKQHFLDWRMEHKVVG